MPRGSDLYLGADEAATFHRHVFGADPSAADDFRLSEHSPYPSRWGRKDVTVSGSPSNAAALGDLDGRAKGLDGSDDDFSVPDAADLDVAAGEDLTVAIAVSRGSTSSAETIIEKWDGTVGWRVRLQSDGTVDFIADDNGTEDRASSSTSIDDGSVHTIVATIDGSDGTLRIHVDGTHEGTDAKGSGSIANSATVNVGASSFSGTVHLWTVGKTWATEPQSAYFHSLVTDRTTYAPQLDRFVFGTRETGLKRRLPSYLQPVAGDIEFWSAARRLFRFVDGQGMVQLTDCAGPNFAVQRTGSRQPLANVTNAQGNPASDPGHSMDSWSGDGTTRWNARGFVQDPEPDGGVLWAAVVQNDGSNSSEIITRHRDGTDPDMAFWVDPVNEEFNGRVADSGSNSAAVGNVPGIVHEKAVITYRMDVAAGEVEITWDSKSDSVSATTSFTPSSLQSTEREIFGSNGAGDNFDGGGWEMIHILGPQTKSYRDNTLRPELKRIHGIG